jgi:anthranilate synthase component 1
MAFATGFTQMDCIAFGAQGYTRVPLVRTLHADLETPLGAYLKLTQGRPYSYLFESVQGGEQLGRYSIIGLPATRVIEVRGRTLRDYTPGGSCHEFETDDPLAWIDALRREYRVAAAPNGMQAAPKFVGGLVGYFGYETVHLIEPSVAASGVRPDPLNQPDAVLMLSEQLVVFDNATRKLHLVVLIDPREPDAHRQGELELAHLEAKLRNGRAVVPGAPAAAVHNTSKAVGRDICMSLSRQAFEASVERIKEYILAGDVMQVVLAQRQSQPYRAEPLDLYRALRAINPSPHMFYLHLDEFQIVGSSPEILVRLEAGRITVRPIAGTRPRGQSIEQDLRLETELCADPKERAEHLMLLDLGRNDVGRAAAPGSVEVTEAMVVERYAHVMHMVSNVRGALRNGNKPLDVLRATFPAGTVSGAPKVRAMQIIHELEPVKRGVYAGAVGYIAWNGDIETAIAIRTAVVKDGAVHIQAGAGIVADSDPACEWDETQSKARSLFAAAALAEAGVDA